MKIELTEIGNPEKTHVFIAGKVFDLEYKTGLVYPQHDPAAAVTFKEDTAIDGYHEAIYNRRTRAIEKKIGQASFLEMPIKLPEILFKGPIRDDNILNEINRKGFDDLTNVVALSGTIRDLLNGELREVDIMGDKYLFIPRFDEFQSADDFLRSLPFKQFVETENGVAGWYDKVKKEMVVIDPKHVFITPANVYWVELPRLFRIDPVAYARIDNMWKDEHRRNDAAYINDGMIELNPVAKATHISQTYIAKIIAKIGVN